MDIRVFLNLGLAIIVLNHNGQAQIQAYELGQPPLALENELCSSINLLNGHLNPNYPVIHSSNQRVYWITKTIVKAS